MPATPAPADDIVIAPSTPSPVTGTSGGTSEGSCGDGESFRITSDVLPVVQGCYQQTTLSFDDGGQYEEYTVSGLTEGERMTMFGSSSAFADDDGDEVSRTGVFSLFLGIRFLEDRRGCVIDLLTAQKVCGRIQ